MSRLVSPEYLSFPLRVGAGGPHTSGRGPHVRQQIEQVLFTDPGERVFRPEFGAGVRALVFEPNASALAEVTRKRLLSSLAVALEGEVDPRTLRVDVRGEGEKLLVAISYSLATIGQAESYEIPVGLTADSLALEAQPEAPFQGAWTARGVGPKGAPAFRGPARPPERGLPAEPPGGDHG